MRGYLVPKRRRLAPEEKAANLEKRAAKARLAKTCQVCGRPIFAETGVIAHHGYQRPGTGWQTASCQGAQAAPFEASKAELVRYIAALEGMAARDAAHVADMEAERVPFGARGRKDALGRIPYVEFTRETLDQVRRDNPACFWGRSPNESFDSIKERAVLGAKRQLEGLRQEIAAQKRRADGWVQTHRFEDGAGWTRV